MMRTLLTAAMILLCAPCRANTATAEAALDRAVAYLWSKQCDDGSWRSETYGVMKGGESLTPFVLSALLQTIDEMSSGEAGQARLAAKFIGEHLDDDGALGRSDPDVLEYPVYSTAYAIKSLTHIARYKKMLGEGPWSNNGAAIRKMRSFLVAAQYQEDNGFDPNDVAYGGWGFNAPVRSGVVGHMDLGHTRMALEVSGLSIGSDESARQGLSRALRFLAVVQKQPESLPLQPLPEGAAVPDSLPFDGGFYFSPIALSANKGLYDEESGCWRSYATATCDGILALLAAGVPEVDPRLVAAVNWLKQHREVDYPQGIPIDHPEPWGEAVRFYHYMVRAEVYQRLAFPAEDRQRLADAVVARQRPDGSFVNAEGLMKEDDPLLCTAQAVVALVNCLLLTD